MPKGSELFCECPVVDELFGGGVTSGFASLGKLERLSAAGLVGAGSLFASWFQAGAVSSTGSDGGARLSAT
jgi:hypothetical protein